MSDHRIVQCFGIKRRPHKEPKICKQRFAWTALGASQGNFGSKGVQACPNCGTLPDFTHPFNKYLNNDITYEQAEEEMPAYRKKLGLD